MSISSTIEAQAPLATPEHSENMASGFVDIPPCTIEDVDRALFKLFDKELPLIYTHRNDTRRVPIIFATGERYALVARERPLRDKSKALILPIISIYRSSVNPGNEYGAGVAPDIRQVIKKQLSPEDPIYQRLINPLGMQNSDDLASPNSFIDPDGKQGSKPGRISTRRISAGLTDTSALQKGDVLTPRLGNNIYEIYEMPAPVFFTATYDINVWTQYTMEMNSLMAAFSTETHFKARPSFRIETPKGYYFIAYIDGGFTNNSNFEDFSEDERIVRSSFSMKVTGYFLGSTYKGAPNKIRRYVSAPQVSFDIQIGEDKIPARTGVASSYPNERVLEDMLTENDDQVGHFVEGAGPLLDPKDANPSIGGYSNPNTSIQQPVVSVINAPFSNDPGGPSISIAKVGTTKQGETTYRRIA